MVKHVILDTDIGGDPDDILALLFGLNSTEIKMDMIVTSDEHLGHRAEFTRKILENLGINVPVMQGEDLGNTRCCVVDDLVTSSEGKPNYLQAMKNLVQKNTKTYYVCISPQTNLAKFLEYAPELTSKLKILIMGGAINYRKKGIAQHNIRYDIKSAIKVFNSNAAKMYVLDDITFNPALKLDENHEIYKNIKNSNSPIKNLLLGNLQNFFKKLYPTCFMHDPLTLSYLIKPGFLKFKRRKIELSSKGVMKFAKTGKLTTISISANYEDFMNFLSRRLFL